MFLFQDKQAGLEKGAIISGCELYRYDLWRIWNEDLPLMFFVMQNPSTADASEDDQTIRKCMAFARRDGFGGIGVRNVFALRATDERELLTHTDPVGYLNSSYLKASCDSAFPQSRLVVAWGNRVENKRLKAAYDHAALICMAKSPYCLGTNKSGEPKHPLFLASDTKIIPWNFKETAK